MWDKPLNWKTITVPDLECVTEILYVCPRCSAWVQEPEFHKAWHERTERKS